MHPSVSWTPSTKTESAMFRTFQPLLHQDTLLNTVLKKTQNKTGGRVSDGSLKYSRRSLMRTLRTLGIICLVVGCGIPDWSLISL